MNEESLNRLGGTPLIAILRGVVPDEAVEVAGVLVEAGVYCMEVTLDSPRWEASMEKINARYGDAILPGAGTVLSPRDVDRVHGVGGRVVISPNARADVIHRSKARGMISIPGCLTPTECFAALDAGADLLKIFPAHVPGADYIKSLAVVLPDGARLCPTGGVDAHNIKEYLAAGAFAAGIGSALYQPGIGRKKLAESARHLVAAVRE